MSEAASTAFSSPFDGAAAVTPPPFANDRERGRDRASGGNILIIDDEAGIRESLQTLLELEGFAVETSESGEAGLARMAERTFDLVLLDYQNLVVEFLRNRVQVLGALKFQANHVVGDLDIVPELDGGERNVLNLGLVVLVHELVFHILRRNNHAPQERILKFA